MKSISQKRRDFVLKLGRALGVAGAVGVAPHALAKSAAGSRANIKSIALKKGANGQQRLIFQLDKSIHHKTFSLSSPDRFVIDFLNTRAKGSLKLGRNKANSGLNLVKRLRQSNRNANDFRVVLDLAKKAKAVTQIKSNGTGYFLEVALSPRQDAKTDNAPDKIKKAINAVGRRSDRKRAMVIAIDAGHGGKDPGAVGKRGTKEKTIALQIAQRLKNHIERQPGMRAVMIRNDDYYVSLRKRILKARKHKADLFISIHADANPNRSLTGSSVYILSESGASSEAARWLANQENSYEERLAGAHLRRKNKVVNSMLLDLSLSNTIDRSLELASGVLKELGRVNHLLRHRVESAGFVVLKSPDIPSMLVETAFISNAMEEKRLKTKHHQEKLARAIFKGVRQYQVAMNESETFYENYG